MYNFYLGSRADLKRDPRKFLVAIKRMLPRWANSLPDPEYNVLIDLLDSMAARKKPVFVETGAGASTIALIHFAMLRGGHAYSWDMNSSKGSFIRSVCAETLEMFHQKPISSHWTFVSSSSLSTHTGLPILGKLTQRVDLSLHDSDHTWNNVKGEIEAIIPLLRAGSVVCVDDANQDMVHTYEPIINVTRRKLGLQPIAPLPGNRGRPLYERVPQLLESRFASVKPAEINIGKYARDDLYYPWYQLNRGNDLAWYQFERKDGNADEALRSQTHVKRFGAWQVSGARVRKSAPS